MRRGDPIATALALVVGISLVALFYHIPLKRSLSTWEDTLSFIITNPVPIANQGASNLSSECKAFAVATTIFDPSYAVMQLLALQTLCLVVVGDRKTNCTAWEALLPQYGNRLAFLSFETQTQHLRYATVHAIPPDHFARKNIGYLFAIEHGAEHIYDFDDDNVLKDGETLRFQALLMNASQQTTEWTVLSPEAHAHHLLNPYPMFKPVDALGAPQFAWPRGLPLEFVLDARTFELKPSPTDAVAAVYQSLADLDPDVDAVYRMTRPLPLRFTLPDSILIPPKGVFAPWNAQATLFTSSAFFGLSMPISVTGRVSDIWRSYITTRLLWMAGYHVAFVSPLVDQHRNPHEYHADLLAERDLYERSNALIRTLIELDETGLTSLPEAYLRLIEALVQRRFLSEMDLGLAKAWLSDLERLGYIWPPIRQGGAPYLQSPVEPRLVDKRKTADATPTMTTASFKPQETASTAQYATSKDTAVCVSGQLRTLNLKPDAPDFPHRFEPMTTHLTSDDMAGRTVAQSIVAHLYPSIGTFDVYMTVSTLEGPNEPKVNDLSVCESLRPAPPNRLFCEVIRQEELGLITPKIWDTFYYAGQPLLQQGLLQQLYGQQRCALMMARQQIQERLRYTYAVRIRPDEAILRPMPSIHQLVRADEPTLIKMIAHSVCCCGNEDTFGVGHFHTMQLYFNRIIALHLQESVALLSALPVWTAENFLTEYLQQTYGVRIVGEASIIGCIVKPHSRAHPSQA
jgi:hypothetical protein